jgi:signal peptidase II
MAIKNNSIVKSISYNLIIGGAIGNIMDRMFRGAVFDYVYLHYHQYGFAVFNLADSYITLGAILMIYDCYILQKNIEINDKKNYNAHAPK